jgi:hypothetical protein
VVGTTVVVDVGTVVTVVASVVAVVEVVVVGVGVSSVVVGIVVGRVVVGVVVGRGVVEIGAIVVVMGAMVVRGMQFGQLVTSTLKRHCLILRS